MTITIRILTHIYCFIVKTGFGATQTAENPLEMASTWIRVISLFDRWAEEWGL